MSLPTLTPTAAKIPQILAHVKDCWPDDYDRIHKYLNDRTSGAWTYAHEDVADALTDYCRANNLGPGVSETSVRRWRKKTR